MHAVGFSTSWVRGCVRIWALCFIHVYICGDGLRLDYSVLPLAIEYTVVAADRIARLDGLNVQAHSLSSFKSLF